MGARSRKPRSQWFFESFTDHAIVRRDFIAISMEVIVHIAPTPAPM